ncbi:LysE family translocator [Chachezhania sediminis]|uniref:LysE family translocator n=1 Tax=Chachezhania sediminis TaxID=2599291 RepID=UPI00131B72DC|nr:LysE family translocator [Chachezhania sediminis]
MTAVWPDAAGLGSIALAFLVVAASPGPANLGCASVAMAQGRGAGLRFGLGLALGLAVWGLCAASGLGALLAVSQTGLVLLKIAGGAYLLYLAWLSARSAVRPGAGPRAQPTVRGRWLLRGMLLNLSNPKAVFAWLAALAVGLGPEQGMGAVALATAMCMLIGFLNYVAWAWAFSTDGAQAVHARFRRWIDGATAALFAGLGLGLLRSAATR